LKIDWRTAFGCAGVLALFGVFVLVLRWAGNDREVPRPEHRVVARELTLRGFQQVPESDVFRATLMDGTGGYSSGYGRSRNILFVEASGQSRWLLGDDDHVLDEHPIPSPSRYRFDEESTPPVGIAVLAKPVTGEPKTGDLYLCDPTGRRVQPIAQHVREVHGVALAPEGLAVLYEGSGGYVLAYYAQADFRKVREVNVAVPALK
jgi:hypothetical protein